MAQHAYYSFLIKKMNHTWRYFWQNNKKNVFEIYECTLLLLFFSDLFLIFYFHNKEDPFYCHNNISFLQIELLGIFEKGN